jgi:hypothetical protein
MTNTPHAIAVDLYDQGQPLLTDSSGQFARNYNKTSFAFEHGLGKNPLFDTSSLVDYSRRLPADGGLAYWSNGSAKVNDGWDKNSGPRYSLKDTIANIADNNSLVLLKRVDLDPEYGPFVRNVMATIIKLVGPALAEDIIIGRATILVASPRRLTSYHIDADTNFLFQLRGDKKFSVFDQSDRTLITDPELEGYYSGDLNAAKFNEARQKDAHAYDLNGAVGVHVPCMAPHWAANSDNISVALSINFDLHSIVPLARIYKLNHRLRRYGLKPTPPGKSRSRDQLKLAAAGGIAAVRRVLRGQAGTAAPSMN